MTGMTRLGCACGGVQLDVEGAPIVSAACCCDSCRLAGERLQALSGAPAVLGPIGETPYVLYRKDRVHVRQGAEKLAYFRLAPRAPTRRVVATCCNTPVFLELEAGHWLSLYVGIWPADAAPPLQLRVMTGELPEGIAPPDDDVPNYATRPARFYAKLLGAWVAMGFRSPKIGVGAGELSFEQRS